MGNYPPMYRCVSRGCVQSLGADKEICRCEWRWYKPWGQVVLTEGNIRELVRVADEEMDGVAKERRHKQETVESELADVRRRLARLYNLVETTDMTIDDFKPRIRDHRER